MMSIVQQFSESMYRIHFFAFFPYKVNRKDALHQKMAITGHNYSLGKFYSKHESHPVEPSVDARLQHPMDWIPNKYRDVRLIP